MLTAVKKCSTDNCPHIFQSVNTLYGSSALGRCPVCGVYVDLPCDAKETERGTSDPDVVLARHFASQPGIPFAAQQVLMRLADKVEGKK